MDNKELAQSIDKVNVRTTKKEMEALLKQAKENLLKKESGKITVNEKVKSLPMDLDHLEEWAKDITNAMATETTGIVNRYRNLQTELSNLTEQVKTKEKELKEMYEVEQSFLDLAALVEAGQTAERDHNEAVKEMEAKFVIKHRDLIKNHQRKMEELDTEYKDKKKAAEFDYNQVVRDFNDEMDKTKRKTLSDLEVYVTSKEAEIADRLKELSENEAFVNKNKDLIKSFDSKVETQTKAKVEEYIDKVRSQHELELDKKDLALNNQKEIYDNKIDSLRRELENTNKYNEELKASIKEAQIRVQEIASTAVKNAKSEVHTHGFTDKNK